MANIRLISGITLVLLVVIFTLQNTEVVNINFLFWQFSMSRVLLIFVLLLTGVVIGWLLHSLAKHGKKQKT